MGDISVEPVDSAVEDTSVELIHSVIKDVFVKQ